jgi:hypothetical protein
MYRSALAGCCLLALTLTPTAAQQPTQAQRDAVRTACRSDFMANCASVQPGGKDALECLLRNEPTLSAPCRSAVNAIATAAPGAAAPAPPASPPPSEASAPAAGQSSMQPPVPPPATKTSRPPTAPSQKTPSHATTSPAGSTASTAAGASATAPTAAPAVAPLGPIRPMLPRRALMVLAQCRSDRQRLCAGVPPGGGEIFACLAANARQLSAICYDALARVSQ